MTNDFSKRIQKLLEILTVMAAGDLSKRPQISKKGDELDAIAYAICLLSDEMVAMNKKLAVEQEKAVRQSQSKSTFLANMSHEIRTPLTAIMGYVDFLTFAGDSSQDRKHHLSRIANNCLALKRLVDDALDLMKVEAGEITIRESTVDLRNDFKDVIKELGEQFKKPGVVLKLEFHKSVPKSLVLDSGRIRQLLLNLVGNSLKFTDQGTVILRVTFDTKKRVLTIDVSDTGIGICKEFKDQLFQPFSQGQEGIDRKLGGTGLGLALSRALCQAMGGDLVLINSELGKGSHFRASVSAGSNHKNVVKSKVHGAAKRSLAGLRILLVEDFPDIRELFTQMLGHWGATIDCCCDGAEALRMIKNGYDLVLMDLQMPGMDGICATQKLRDEGYVLPIIALTANAMAGERERCISLGFTDYVSKPIDWTALVTTIKESMSTRYLIP